MTSRAFRNGYNCRAELEPEFQNEPRMNKLELERHFDIASYPFCQTDVVFPHPSTLFFLVKTFFLCVQDEYYFSG